MREHNFEEIIYKDTPLGMKAWHCKQCDSIRLFPSSYDQALVNRMMANKLLCLDPLGKLPN